jgi:hypothetical protein
VSPRAVRQSKNSIHRDRPVDPLSDDSLRTVRRPLPGAGAGVEWRVLDGRPPLVIVHDRGQDAVDGERYTVLAPLVRPAVGGVTPVLHRPALDPYVVREQLQRLGDGEQVVRAVRHRPGHRTHRLDLQRHVTQGELRASDLRNQLFRLGDELFVTLPGDVPDPLGHVGHEDHRPRRVRPGHHDVTGQRGAGPGHRPP